jgi:hypothetical protein
LATLILLARLEYALSAETVGRAGCFTPVGTAGASAAGLGAIGGGATGVDLLSSAEVTGLSVLILRLDFVYMMCTVSSRYLSPGLIVSNIQNSIYRMLHKRFSAMTQAAL